MQNSLNFHLNKMKFTWNNCKYLKIGITIVKKKNNNNGRYITHSRNIILVYLNIFLKLIFMPQNSILNQYIYISILRFAVKFSRRLKLFDLFIITQHNKIYKHCENMCWWHTFVSISTQFYMITFIQSILIDIPSFFSFLDSNFQTIHINFHLFQNTRDIVQHQKSLLRLIN